MKEIITMLSLNIMVNKMIDNTSYREELPDVHIEPPPISIPINRVGLRDYRTYIRICRGKCREYLVSINMYTDLPRNMRGVHVSRFIDVIKENQDREYGSLIEFLRRLAKESLTRHEYVYRAEAYGRISLIYNDQYVMMKAGSSIDRDGNTRERLQITLYGITVCPCVQRVYSFLEKTVLEKTPSHMQRARFKLEIYSTKIDIDVYDLVDTIIDSFSSTPRSRLKRYDEYLLIREAYSRPRFVEDVVRIASKLFYDKYRGILPRNTYIAFKVESEESIHPYNTYACIETTIEELDKYFSRNTL